MMKYFKTAMLIISIFSIFIFSGCSDAPADSTSSTSDVDIDLTTLSSSMVYAQVYDFLVNPADYEGKLIRVEGEFVSQYYDVTDMVYNFVIVNDATGCCPQGLEFSPSSNIELPESGTMISIVGEFVPYDENGNQYYRIDASSLKITAI